MEILFRGKRLDNGEWVEGDLCTHKDGSAEIFAYKDVTFSGRLLDGVWHTVDPTTIGQYIGLRDKAENRIFEGDIVDVGSYQDFKVIAFDEERCGYLPFARGDGCGCCEDETVWYKKASVIIVGNIHDNPEMLKEKE